MSAVYNFDGMTTHRATTGGENESSKMVMSVYRNAPQERDRVNDLMRVIPYGLTSVLDVGARDGYLSRLLAGRFPSVTALDLEKPAIAHDQRTRHADGRQMIRQRRQCSRTELDCRQICDRCHMSIRSKLPPFTSPSRYHMRRSSIDKRAAG